MRALVTGGAGFIGSTLVDRLLADGNSVHVLDDLSTGSDANLVDARQAGDRFGFTEFDIRDSALGDLVHEIAPEVVFHLAAQASVATSVDRPYFDAEVNVLGTLNVLEASRRNGIRRVCFAASGGTLYGEVAPDLLPVDEGAPYRPASPYGISKAAAVAYLASYESLYGLQSASLALANVYGPRQDPFGEAGVIAIFATQIIAGNDPDITGDGTQTRDFVFVDDVVDAFVRASSAEATGIFNIGTGGETSINTLCELIGAVAGSAPTPRHVPPRSGEVRRSALDPNRALEVLGWVAATPLAEGLRHTVDAARARLAQ